MPLSASAQAPSEPASAASYTYHPVAVAQTAAPTPIPVIHDDFGARPTPLARPTETQRPPKPIVELKPRPTTKPIPKTGALAGKASWYCKAGVSVCHYRYPPGSMVAAACGKLRAAMGPKWRNRFVTVTRNDTGASVTVQLVDWCGSKDKTIDLYWAAMNALGGTGVLLVTVRW